MASKSAASEDVKLTQKQETDLVPVVSNNASGNDRIDAGVIRKTYPPKQKLELQSRMDEKDMCSIPKIQYVKDLPIETKHLIYKEYNEGVSEENIARKYNTFRRIVCYIVKKYCDMYMDPPEYPLELRARQEKKESSKFNKTHSAKDLSIPVRHQIYKEFNEGMSPEDLARKYNTSPRVVYYIGNYCSTLVPTETRNFICDDYKAGSTVEALAKKYEFNCSIINDLLHRRGNIRKRVRKRKHRQGNNFTRKKIKRPTSNEKLLVTPNTKYAICTEYNAGISIETLIQKYNLKPRTINWILNMSAQQEKRALPRCCNKNTLYKEVYIDRAPMEDDVSKVEIEIKKELEDLDEEDEFEKLIQRKNILQPEIKIEISLESNEMS